MAATPSEMIPLGTQAPDFKLPDTVSGKMMQLNDFKAEVGTVIMFICNHCPFVKHLNAELVRMANNYASKGIKFVAISSNDVENYPQDSPELMKVNAEEENYPFPYLYDESQEVAKAYQAACTPDFYIFDNDLKCTYRGQLDDSRPGNGKPLSGKDMRMALDAMINNEKVDKNQIPSIGCNIKWKKIEGSIKK